MKNLLFEIKRRKISKWLTIYISSAITTIGVIHLLSIRYSWPAYIFDIVFFALLFGIIGLVTIAWFHGKEGKQKIKFTEIIILSVLLLGYLSLVLFQIDFGKKRKAPTNSKVVAVLPFANFNETAETEFFADGMTDDILTQLSKISDLKVISRTSVMKYKKSNLTIPEISEQLGAGTILEGSVRTFGNKIRIVGQLIDANNDIHIWSETYDREMEDIFDIQSDIAERIAAALHAKLQPKEKKLIENKSTENIDAYTFYLKGKHYYYNYTEEENKNAINMFNKALEIDSTYALAIAGLSEAYSQMVAKYWADSTFSDSALLLAKKALRIDQNLPEAYKALASAYQGKEEFELALTNYKQAIDLNPNYWSALLNYGQLKTFLGNHSEALYWIKRSNELAPEDILGNISLSMVYKNLNCYNQAISWAEKAANLDSQNKFVHSFIGDLYLNIGELENAEKYFKQSVAIDSNWIFGWFLGARIETVKQNHIKAKEYYDRYMKISGSDPEYFYAYTLIKLNQQDSAKVILDEELNDYSEYLSHNNSIQIFNYMAFAEIYALVGDKENSFKWWQKAIDKGYTDIYRLKQYPYLDILKTEPRYNILLSQMQEMIDSIHIETENKYPEYFNCN